MIDSSQNKNIKLIKALKTKKERDNLKLFIAEGLRFVEEIPANYHIEFYGVSESFAEKNSLEQFEARGKVLVIQNKLFEEISETKNSQGILAIVKQNDHCLRNIYKDGFYLLAEELNDPGNLGTIIRTAHACNCNGIILSKGSVDIYNPKVLRSTMGSIFHIPIYIDVNIRQAISLLKENEITVYAAHLKGEKFLYDFDFKKGCAFIIGNEARGISKETASLANAFLKIPMPGQAESLNASVAASILLYEVVRQRL